MTRAKSSSSSEPAPGPPGGPRRTVDRITTTRETLPDNSELRDAPIEVWLADLAGDASIAFVRVWKRAGARWAGLGKRNDILPPFDFDPDTLYQQYGDGEYRFVPYDTAGRMRGGRNELVNAGYAGKVRTAPDGTTSTATDEPEPTADLNDLIRLARQQMILKNLREASAGIGEGSAPYPYPERDRGDELDRLQQLATIIAALQPKPLDVAGLLTALGTLLGPIIGRMLSPPDPADKVFSLFEKWLDLRERVDGGGGETDWKTALVRGAASLLDNPAVRAAVLGGGPPALSPPPALPAPPLPRPPVPPPTGEAPSIVNGHPAPPGPPLSADEQRMRHVLATLIWPLVKQAALGGSDDRETYASLIDQHLPGFLEQWSQADTNTAITILATLDRDVLTSVPLQQWLLGFHAWVRDEFLTANDEDDEPGTAPGIGGPAL